MIMLVVPYQDELEAAQCELDALQWENARLRHDLLHAYDRIAAASQVLGKAAERAQDRRNYRRADELMAVKRSLDEELQ